MTKELPLKKILQRFLLNTAKGFDEKTMAMLEKAGFTLIVRCTGAVRHLDKNTLGQISAGEDDPKGEKSVLLHEFYSQTGESTDIDVNLYISAENAAKEGLTPLKYAIKQLKHRRIKCSK